MTLKMLSARDNLTQEVAAKALGISPSTLSKWESGKSFPDVLDINKIENFYRINYNDIIFLPKNTV